MSSGWVKKYPDQSRVGLLFTAGQKYVQVGSGQVRAHLYSLFTKKMQLYSLISVPEKNLSISDTQGKWKGACHRVLGSHHPIKE